MLQQIVLENTTGWILVKIKVYFWEIYFMQEMKDQSRHPLKFFSGFIFLIILNSNASKKSYWNQFLSFAQAANEIDYLCIVHINH